MTGIRLREQLKRLIQLQDLDSLIYALNQEKQAKPAELKILESEFETRKQSLAAIEKSLLDTQKQRKAQELELASKEENIKKLQAQLYSLKTNKEYQAMLNEISGAKADVSLIEDKVLLLMEEGEKLKGNQEKERQKIKEAETVFATEKKKIEGRIKEIDDRLVQLQAQRRDATADIDRKILAQYERILGSRDGLAIVSIRNNSCSGCNMLLPPQVINLIKMCERIITCEVCNRMLYIDETP